MTDEEERGEPHDLPAEDQLDHALGEDHHEHAGREQRDGGEEVGVAAVAADVLQRVDLHEQRDERDEEEGHHRQPVDVLADRQVDARVLPPRPRAHDRFDERLAGVVTALDPLHHRAGGQHRRRRHRSDAQLRAVLGQALADEDDDEECDPRDQRDQPRVLEEPPRSDHRPPQAAKIPFPQANRSRSAPHCLWKSR